MKISDKQLFTGVHSDNQLETRVSHIILFTFAGITNILSNLQIYYCAMPSRKNA